MAQWHIRSTTKPTGGLRVRLRKKKKYQIGRDYLPTHLAEGKKRDIRVRGGNKKIVVLSANIANVMSGGKAHKVKIKTVLENPADPHLVRRNIITKGAIINTEIGKARVTSRPGRDGVINAVLIEKK